MKSLASNTKFAILTAAFFSTGLITLLWTKEFQLLQTDRKAVIAQAMQRNNNLALALENYTIRTIQNADLVLQVVKTEFEKNRSIPNYQEVLKNPAVDNKLFKGVAVLNAKGDLVSSNVNFHPDTLTNFSTREFFQFHKTNAADVLFINKPVVSKSLAIAVIPLSRRIANADGSFGGVVVLQILPSTFTSFYEKAIVNEHDIVSLIAPDGITYARQTGSVPSYGENISKSPLFTYLKENTAGSYFAKDAIRGIPTYFSYRKLNNYPVIATVGITEEDILEGFTKRKKREIAFTAGISILILLFALVACMGILHRRKYIRLLTENEEKYRLMFENSRDAIVLSTAEGEIIAINPAAYGLFKLPPGEKITTNFISLIHTDNTQTTVSNNIPGTEYLNGQIRFTDLKGGSFLGEIQSASYISNKKHKVIVSVIRDTTERNRLQEELNNEKHNRQQLIMKQVIQAQERERTIIGGELHDNVCQILSGIKIYLSLVIKDNERAKEFLPKSMDFLDMAILEIRNLSHTLSAPTLGKKSLVVSVNDLVTDISASSGIQIHFNYNAGAEEISIEQKLAIFRIVQEQVTNIVKHAAATEASISLLKENNFTKLTIKDNGKGFDPGEHNKGIGLNNIEARVKAFSGSFTIVSAAGKGCTLEAAFPEE